MGWQTRNKPFITHSGRIILPLCSDRFSFSLMDYTDDSGSTWKFTDWGESWSPVRDAELPNPGSACGIVMSKNGNWILV